MLKNEIKMKTQMKWVSPFFSESPTAIKESLIKWRQNSKNHKFINKKIKFGSFIDQKMTEFWKKISIISSQKTRIEQLNNRLLPLKIKSGTLPLTILLYFLPKLAKNMNFSNMNLLNRQLSSRMKKLKTLI